MPNAINPNDYNIDFFSSGFLGTTTAENFRNYLFNLNLQELPPEMISSPAGGFLSTWTNDKGAEKDINYAPITNPGDIDEWLVEGNFNVNLFDISYQNSSQNVGANQYGPSSLQAFAYGNPELIVEDTGYIQYPTSVEGGFVENILLNEQLNLGPGIAINFDSPLNEIAKERRKQEAINRVKLKAEDQILGKLNLDPFGLLAGQDLILRDYKITRRPTIVGRVFDFAAKAAGLELPISPIPRKAFGEYGDGDDPQAYNDIMRSTGVGTKSLIYRAIAENKYGPRVEGPRPIIGQLTGAGQAPQKKTYLEEPSERKRRGGKSLVDVVNDAVGRTIDIISGDRRQGEDLPPPSSFETNGKGILKDETLGADNISQNASYGFDGLDSEGTSILTASPLGSKLGLDTWGNKGPNIEAAKEDTIGTKIPIDVDEKFNPGKIPAGTKNDGKPFERGMYWGENDNPFRRGLLKYTQDLVNTANNDKSGSHKARYVGVANDDTNFEAKSGRHKLYSMGNTVLGGSKGNIHYCRSWSVRNPYRKVRDLIRHGVNNGQDSLTRPDLNLSVLDNNGFVKIAPYYSPEMKQKLDARAKGESNLTDGVLKLGNPEVQKYMLSIENLAWQNTEHLLRVPPCEVGPNGGRIMWFPPYDISFTDNSSVNWETTQFIGRGEPIYTYNNTERTGTLAFKVIVDHSMAMTEIKGKGQDALFRYFAGCEDPLEEALPIIPPAEFEEIKIEAEYEDRPLPLDPKFEVKEPAPPPSGEPILYFRNARKYEKDPIGTDIAVELTAPANEEPKNYLPKESRPWPNGYLNNPPSSIPPVIPNPNIDENLYYASSTGGAYIPNPAFSGEVAENYSITVFESLNYTGNQILKKIGEFLLTPDGKRYKIVLHGFTSEAGTISQNKSLAQKRADSVKEYLYNTYLSTNDISIVAENLGSTKTFPTEAEWKDDSKRWETRVGFNLPGQVSEESRFSPEIGYSVIIDPETGDVIKLDQVDEDNIFGNASTIDPVSLRGRSVKVTLEYNPEIDELFINDIKDPVQEYEKVEIKPESTQNIQRTQEEIEKERIAKRLAERASRYMAWECSYFEKMKQEDSFIYDNLIEKLKYFHPAFHSMTPEGFNARLTFLKQCTRQGPNVANNEPSNLAFGKPPICVLRVGDFYHTKIVIDSVNLSFDPLQWDLNPEGIGVQPMVCNVDLNFKFIGGSSLGGPISQLQNAVGFNFFANTGLYNPRTIYSSVGEYKVNRPDSASGLIEEISNETIKTVGSNNGKYAYGSYLVPGQVITEKGTFGNEKEQIGAGKTPTNTTELKNKQDQVKQETTTKPAEMTKEEKDKIEDEFENNREETNPNNYGEHCDIEGFDCKNGRYTTRYKQNLKIESSDSIQTTVFRGPGELYFNIPKETKVYLNKIGDISRIIIGKANFTDPVTEKLKTVYNTVTYNCDPSREEYQFTYHSKGIGVGDKESRVQFSNDTLSNVIKKVFCKEDKMQKSWTELTNCKDCEKTDEE